MKKVLFWSLIIFSITIFGIYRCEEDAKVIKIGAVLPLTGDGAIYGIEKSDSPGGEGSYNYALRLKLGV